MNIEKMREEFEARYPMPFACGWNSKTKEYDCIWYEHHGDEEVEAKILQHNDRLSVWVASRESLVIELPKSRTLAGRGYIDNCREAIEAQGLKVKP